MIAKATYSEKPTSAPFHPKKLAMYLIMLSIIMIFASLTSAYIVRRMEGNWLAFDLPPQFLWSTLLIILSSVTMQLAYRKAKTDELGQVKLFVVLTALLGSAFFILQSYICWVYLFENGVYFGGASSNPSGSFLWVLVWWVHGFHIITGIVFLLIILVRSFTYKVHSKNMLAINMCNTYWHFLGVLWIYIYVFLIFNH